ncbi:hypothetical protein N9H63_01725 [bacterium]|nr:hypothetical protein [bacterium]
MSVDNKILEELKRHNTINNYLVEQEEPVEPTDDLGGEDMDMDVEMDAEEIAEPVDVDTDPEVEKLDDEGNIESDEDMGGDTEELEITDLVNKQNEISDKQDEYMDSMFDKLNDLESKLSQMDTILSKINDIEAKVEKYREKSPEEKLQLRSLDSYPYNQKLTDFFADKEVEMQQTGKNEYVLTSDEVENYSDADIKKSFDTPINDEE